MLNSQGQTIQVGFPNSIYISVEHDILSATQFSFEFWYLDLKPNVEDAKKSITGYDVVTRDVTGK